MHHRSGGLHVVRQGIDVDAGVGVVVAGDIGDHRQAEAVAVGAAVVDRHPGDAVGVQHHPAATVAGVLVGGYAVSGSGNAAAEGTADRRITVLLIRGAGVERTKRSVMAVVTTGQ
ncbi:hypothetical protein D3C78_901580 [compost metagenome]